MTLREENLSPLALQDINDDVLQATKPPPIRYYLALALLAAGIGWGWLAWTWQVWYGMGAAGINHPVGWGLYIGNFVFWVGIAHSGTLISAILYLVRARWRNAVSRSSEAMTVFAVMTAGLFPLIHLGRVWIFYYILPYPSQRQIWPNFLSPLVWDVLAVGTYFTVSVIFFYVGLIPDLAAARDRAEQSLGLGHWRSRLYQKLALGWSGAASQWRHYGRSYLFFAALATPLVISVHSIVSWDFAMSLLPGWHTTVFAPYFVAGAIHSGLAMVLTLMIPMRRLLGLGRIISDHHFEMVALTMLVTTAIIGYSYIVEPFAAWFSGDRFEQQFAFWRAFEWGNYFTYIYWSLILLNVIAPLMFVFRKVRQNMPALFMVSILVNIGMWLERFHIVPTATSHDFLPHNWGQYLPSGVEISITLGSFCFFFFFFLVFSKLLPTVPIAEFKELIGGEDISPEAACDYPSRPPGRALPPTRLLAIYGDADSLVHAIKQTCDCGFQTIEAFSPIKLRKVHWVMGHPRSPVRHWTLIGAVSGLLGGFGLAIGAATVNNLIVGGKPPVAWIPYCIVGFEGTILLGCLANLAGILFHARLYRGRPVPGYDPGFSVDKFGLLIACEQSEIQQARSCVESTSPEKIHVAGD